MSAREHVWSVRVIVAASDLERYVRLLNGRHHKCHLKNISTSLTKIFALNTILFRYDGNNLCLVSGDLAAAAVLVYSLLVIKPPTQRPCPKLHLISPLPLGATISDCRSCAIWRKLAHFTLATIFLFTCSLVSNQLPPPLIYHDQNVAIFQSFHAL